MWRICTSERAHLKAKTADGAVAGAGRAPDVARDAVPLWVHPQEAMRRQTVPLAVHPFPYSGSAPCLHRVHRPALELRGGIQKPLSVNLGIWLQSTGSIMIVDTSLMDNAAWTRSSWFAYVRNLSGRYHYVTAHTWLSGLDKIKKCPVARNVCMKIGILIMNNVLTSDNTTTQLLSTALR